MFNFKKLVIIQIVKMVAAASLLPINSITNVFVHQDILVSIVNLNI